MVYRGLFALFGLFLGTCIICTILASYVHLCYLLLRCLGYFWLLSYFRLFELFYTDYAIRAIFSLLTLFFGYLAYFYSVELFVLFWDLWLFFRNLYYF